MQSSLVLHEQRAKLTRSMAALLYGIPTAMLLGGLYLYRLPGAEAREEAFALLGAAALVALIIWLVLPTKYQILTDGIRIRLRLFRIDIPYSTIKAIEYPLRSSNFGVNFATSFSAKDIIKIKRGRARDMTISPQDPLLFLEHLPPHIRTNLVRSLDASPA